MSQVRPWLYEGIRATLGRGFENETSSRERRSRRATEGGDTHGRTGSAYGRRYDRQKFSEVRGTARRSARDPRKEVRHLAADELARVAADIQGRRLRPAC